MDTDINNLYYLYFTIHDMYNENTVCAEYI